MTELQRSCALLRIALHQGTMRSQTWSPRCLLRGSFSSETWHSKPVRGKAFARWYPECDLNESSFSCATGPNGVKSRPRAAADTTWYQAFETAAELSSGRRPQRIPEAIEKSREAARLNPTHSYPKFLLYSILLAHPQQMQYPKEANEVLQDAMISHCYHAGGVTQALQRACQQDIRDGNLNLFV